MTLPCQECGRELRLANVPRLVIVASDGTETGWCARCLAGQSYAGPLWSRVQARLYLLRESKS